MDLNTYLQEHLESVIVIGEMPSMLSPFTNFKNEPAVFVINDVEPSTIVEIPADTENEPIKTEMIGATEVISKTEMIGKTEMIESLNQVNVQPVPKLHSAKNSYIYDYERDERLRFMMRGLYAGCAAVDDFASVNVVSNLYKSITCTDAMKYLTKILDGSMTDIFIFTCTALLANSVNGNIFKNHVKKNKLIINILATLTRDIIDGNDYFEMVVRLRKLDDPNINQALYRGFSQQYSNIEMDRAPFTEYKLLAAVMYVLDLYKYSVMNNKHINFKKIIIKVAQGEQKGLIAAVIGWLLGGINKLSVPRTIDTETFVNNNFGNYFTGDVN